MTTESCACCSVDRRVSERDGGSIVILCAILTLALGMVVAGTYGFTRSVGQSTIENIEVRRARLLAQSGMDYALVKVWDDYLADSGGTPGSPTHYRAYLESELGLENGEQISIDSAGGPTFSTGTLTALTVSRQDAEGATNLTIEATAEAGGTSVTVSGVNAVDGAEYPGFEYALFANNVNCTFCHAEIDSVQRYGEPYKRVKIASLETLVLREGKANSTIAGTLYARGQITDKQGDPIDMDSIVPHTLSGYKFDSNGLIELDQYGDKIPTTLVQGQTDDDGKLLPNANFYQDYPSNPLEQTDGVVPDVFPNAFPDVNQNRVIDDSEYQTVAEKASGTLTGGVIYHVPEGTTFNGTALPATGNTSGVETSLEGNVILKGSSANPLVISGRVVVDGDVMISGVVKGSGSIYARGNVYLVGDMTYADGTDIHGDRSFGLATDGTENKLGITAGANILVGDYLTPKSGKLDDVGDRTTGDSDGGFSFALSELALFNRKEWQRTQPTLPGTGGVQISNSTYDPDYIPRYYVQKLGDPVYIFAEPDDDSDVYWDDTIQFWLGKEHPGKWKDALTSLGDFPEGAVVSALEPTNEWISESNLKSIWISESEAHVDGEPATVDAVLYTSGLAFSIYRKDSNTDGQLTVNGGILANDVGILAAGGLKLNYDSAVGDLMEIKRYDVVALSRKLLLARVKRVD